MNRGLLIAIVPAVVVGLGYILVGNGWHAALIAAIVVLLAAIGLLWFLRRKQRPMGQ